MSLQELVQTDVCVNDPVNTLNEDTLTRIALCRISHTSYIALCWNIQLLLKMLVEDMEREYPFLKSVDKNAILR